MIDWIIFLPACFALNMACGPSNLLAMTHGAKSGVPFAQKAAIARLIVFVPMIAASALGLGLLLTTSEVVYGIAKFIGAAYLIWLGIALWRSAKTLNTEEFLDRSVSMKTAFKREALLAISNPKAILTFAAFFPQFVILDAYWQSYAMLGAAFLIMEAIAIFAYALGGSVAAAFATDKIPVFQRISGAMMCVFGTLLLVSS